MKKPLKITLIVVGVLVAIPVVFVGTTATVNVVATNAEAADRQVYGELVDVGGKKMNVVDQGSGDQTIVLLPGQGTASPAIDFAPLIDQLDNSYRVITVEPFGYGRSDDTDIPRTTANIASEVHEAVSALGVDEYVLAGHSIAGIYALEYVERFRDEVTAFVGIDTSIPGQPGMDAELPLGLFGTLKNLGLVRLIAGLSDDPYAGTPYTAEQKEQLALFANKNSMSPTMLNEMEHIAPNFAEAENRTFPANLPVLLFAQQNNTGVEGWAELHEKQAAHAERGELILLDADHYLHHTKSPEIAEEMKRFLGGVAA